MERKLQQVFCDICRRDKLVPEDAHCFPWFVLRLSSDRVHEAACLDVKSGRVGEREAWNWSVSTWTCCKNSLKMRQFYLVQGEESYYCSSCCTGCWENTWIQGRISFHKGWYLPLWKAASWSPLCVDLFFSCWGHLVAWRWTVPGHFPCPFFLSLLRLFCFQMTLVMSPVDDGAFALWKFGSRWPGVSVGALLKNLCVGHLGYPQVLAASRTVSCEVGMLSLSKKCWWSCFRDVVWSWRPELSSDSHLLSCAVQMRGDTFVGFVAGDTFVGFSP